MTNNNKQKHDFQRTVKPGEVLLGNPIKFPATWLRDIDFTPGGESDGQIYVFNGRIFNLQSRLLKNGKTYLRFNLTDNTGSVTTIVYTNQPEVIETLKDGISVTIEGRLEYEDFPEELIIYPKNMSISMHPVEESFSIPSEILTYITEGLRTESVETKNEGISGISCKTAYRFVKKYFEVKRQVVSSAELMRLVDCLEALGKSGN